MHKGKPSWQAESCMQAGCGQTFKPCKTKSVKPLLMFAVEGQLLSEEICWASYHGHKTQGLVFLSVFTPSRTPFEPLQERKANIPSSTFLHIVFIYLFVYFEDCLQVLQTDNILTYSQ